MTASAHSLYPPGTAPAVGRAGIARQRNLRAVVYLGLVIASVIGHFWYAQAMRVEEPILVITRPVAAGHPIGAADIGRESGRLPASSRGQAIPASSLAEVIGRPASHDLQPGDLVVQSSLASRPVPQVGQVAVTVAVRADFATTLTPGERVDVIALDNKGEVLAREVVVQALTTASGGTSYISSGGPTSATLIVGREEASRIVAAAARSGIALAQLPRLATTITGPTSDERDER